MLIFNKTHESCPSTTFVRSALNGAKIKRGRNDRPNITCDLATLARGVYMFGFSFGLTDGLTPLDIPTVTQQLEQGRVGFIPGFGIDSV